MNKKQAGFAHAALLFIIIIVIIGALGYLVYNKQKSNSSDSTNKKSTTENSKTVADLWPDDTNITWGATGQGSWMAFPYDAKPPTCPEPLTLALPTPNISKATSILYPGQTRLGSFEGKGSNYKAHGGIRFDKSTNDDISVVMPFDGSVMRGSRFLVDGEIQYGFDIVNACGVMIRLGHLRDLTPAFQAIADTFPAPIEGDSRTTKVTPNIPFKTGDKIATAVGFRDTKNVGFDYGVYDLRKDNEASKDAAYKAAHADTAELTSHGLCWLNLLNDNDMKAVKALPAGDQASGNKSDYCK